MKATWNPATWRVSLLATLICNENTEYSFWIKFIYIQKIPNPICQLVIKWAGGGVANWVQAEVRRARVRILALQPPDWQDSLSLPVLSSVKWGLIVLLKRLNEDACELPDADHPLC